MHTGNNVPFFIMETIGQVFDLLADGYVPEYYGIRLAFVSASKQWLNLVELAAGFQQHNYTIVGENDFDA